MALHHAIIFLLMAAAAVLVVVAEASDGNSAFSLAHFPSASSRTCDELAGECMAEEDEEIGVSRRGLYGRVRFISYGALARNQVPCSRRGQSYYNCVHRGSANPYRRGCSVITRCARFLD